MVRLIPAHVRGGVDTIQVTHVLDVLYLVFYQRKMEDRAIKTRDETGLLISA
jgi:hypothetical protein